MWFTNYFNWSKMDYCFGINFLFILYAQNDKWVNEKLLLKIYSLSWKIKWKKYCLKKIMMTFSCLYMVTHFMMSKHVRQKALFYGGVRDANLKPDGLNFCANMRHTYTIIKLKLSIQDQLRFSNFFFLKKKIQHRICYKRWMSRNYYSCNN